ncbi:MAG: site-specific DNA-methyltransferase [Candidatus Methanomethylicaceae archaeon]|nr:site-specific DNA-methyltransferase [Anaerolineales bacterium]
MAKIEISKVELVWPGKYNEDGTLREIPRMSLPFQVVERVNESRATRESRKRGYQFALFDTWEGKEGDTFEDGWHNKLIWGDNLLVMSSLLDKFAGKIDLIYIDPPFATGADFSFTAQIGDEGEMVFKQQSILEEKAYRDTWAGGLSSYLTMLYQRLSLIYELLSERGALFIHLGPNVAHYLRPVLDEIFGPRSFRNDIVWKRTDAHNDPNRCGVVHDIIFFYTKGEKWIWNPEEEYQPLPESTVRNWYSNEEVTDKNIVNRLGIPIPKGTVRYFNKADITGAGTNPNDKPFKGIMPPPGRHWAYTLEKMEQLDKEGRIYYSKSGRPYEKRYLDESKGIPPQSIWSDITMLRGLSKNTEDSEWQNFETQKPERLLERIIRLSSEKSSIVADFFCGSGTTLAVAEKLGRRWIGCDLSRWAIHVTRKRLLEIPNCKPFDILNLGKYERQYWSSVTFGNQNDDAQIKQAIYEYLAFILKLYGAQPVSGLVNLHGKKGKAMVHIGAVDSPVTFEEVSQAIDECARLNQKELHVLGWEWEMGLAGPNNDLRKGGLIHQIAKEKGIKLILLQIPREVMEKQAVESGDIKFFELAYFEAVIHKLDYCTVQIELKDFASPNMDEIIPEDIRAKIHKWSDYIDYWSIDWNFQNDSFMQGWVAYRTLKDRTLPLSSEKHTYDKPGKYRILVKVIDIFGNDTSQAYDIEVE